MQNRFQRIDGKVSDSHASDVKDDIPILNLTWNHQFPNGLFLNKDYCSKHSISILETGSGQIEHNDGFKLQISTTDVEEAIILNK